MIARLRDAAIPLVTIIVILILWQGAATYFEVPRYLVPKPTEIAQSLHKGLSGLQLLPHIIATLKGMLGGYALGCPIGLVVAALLSEYRFLEKAFYPILVAFQSIPKVALAPVIIVWFGFGLESKIVLVALMTFFPLFINTFAGLRSYNRDLEDMFRVFGASRWRIFYKVKLPSAASHIFAGLQTTVILAMLGTVISEMISAEKGLGFFIQASMFTFDVPMMFACTIILAVIGVIAMQLVIAARRATIFWEREAR